MTEQAAKSELKLSAILIVQNEAHCLDRCLRSIAPIADEIIVLDSGSTDETISIAHSFGAIVEVTDWPGFGPQKNRALSKAQGEWVLSIDADEYLTPELAASIRRAIGSTEATANGYLIEFLARWYGKPVRFGAWAGRRHLRLFRRGCARFSDDLVHERVVCQPPYSTLDGLMIHDTVATDDEAIEKAQRYAEIGAQTLSAHGRGGFFSALIHSAWTFIRGYLVQGGFLDGIVGWKVARACARGTWLRYRIAGRQLSASRNRRDVSLGAVAVALVLIAFFTAVLWLIQGSLPQQHLIFGYLVPLAVIAFRYGSMVILWSTIASDFGAAFFLYPPMFDVRIDDPLHVAELLLFTLFSFLVGVLLAERKRRFAD